MVEAVTPEEHNFDSLPPLERAKNLVPCASGHMAIDEEQQPPDCPLQLVSELHDQDEIPDDFWQHPCLHSWRQRSSASASNDPGTAFGPANVKEASPLRIFL